MIAVRADANNNIGAGHVMRCLSLADELKKKGEAVVFIVSDTGIVNYIKERRYDVTVLKSSYDNLDNEISELIKIIEEEKINKIIVDSYYVTDLYLSALQGACEVVYFDDYGNHAYPVDVVINYNVYSTDIDYRCLYLSKGLNHTRFITGSRYAPLRSEFRNVPISSRDAVSNVLISTGAADKYHICLKILQWLKKNRPLVNGITFHVIAGALNSDVNDLKLISDSMDCIKLHSNVKNMRELMCECDLAISAAGSTLYELCACGIPFVTFILEDNQLLAGKKFNEIGAGMLAGDSRTMENIEADIFNRILRLVNDSEERKLMQKKARQITDGTGAERLAIELLH